MEPTAKHFKSIFLSDIHLGTKGCQSERLLDFLHKRILSMLQEYDNEFLLLIEARTPDMIDLFHNKFFAFHHDE